MQNSCLIQEQKTLGVAPIFWGNDGQDGEESAILEMIGQRGCSEMNDPLYILLLVAIYLGLKLHQYNRKHETSESVKDETHS